jgi:hypothetical protein
MKKVPTIPATELLYFDSSCLGTEKFRDLIRRLAVFSGAGEVAVIVLNPPSTRSLVRQTQSRQTRTKLRQQ